VGLEAPPFRNAPRQPVRLQFCTLWPSLEMSKKPLTLVDRRTRHSERLPQRTRPQWVNAVCSIAHADLSPDSLWQVECLHFEHGNVKQVVEDMVRLSAIAEEEIPKDHSSTWRIDSFAAQQHVLGGLTKPSGAPGSSQRSYVGSKDALVSSSMVRAARVGEDEGTAIRDKNCRSYQQ